MLHAVVEVDEAFVLVELGMVVEVEVGPMVVEEMLDKLLVGAGAVSYTHLTLPTKRIV